MSRSFARSLVCSALVCSAACRVDVDGGEPPPVVKAPPAAVSTPDAWHLFDRSVSSGFTPSSEPVQVTLDRAEQITAIKVYGSAPYRLRVTGANGLSLGFAATDLSSLGAGWHVLPSSALTATDHVELRFEPLGKPGLVPELELWVVDDHPVASRPDLASKDLPAGFVAFASDAPSIDVGPSECTNAGVLLTRAPPELRRAYLVYDAKGLFRPFAVQRTINGLAEQGGAWIAGEGGSFVEEIDPAVLNLGPNELRFCLPNAALNANISNLRVVGELDRGVRLPSTIAIGADGRDGAALLDGDLATTQDIAAGDRVVMSFDRLIAPDALVLHGKGSQIASVECVDKTGATEPLAVTAQTTSAFGVAGASHGCTQLAFTASAAMSLSELDVVGSGAAEPVDWPRVVVTSPPEHFGETAYVGGFVARAHLMTGAIRTTVAGQASLAMTGDFGRLLTRTGDLSSPWSVVVTARAPDGSTQTKQVVLDRDQRVQLAAAKSAPAATTNAPTPDARYGRAGDSTVVNAAAHTATTVRLGTHVGVNVPAGAVAAATPITVRHLADDTLPPLDPGMINVTAPQGHGYEFLPHGQKFAQPIEVLVPFDPALIPDEMKPEDVNTFYYDPAAERWKKLDRTAIDVGAHVIHSSTTHFTIMVDAVLTVPKNPSPLSLDPTSISSIGAASPAANIDLIEQPQANSTGDARVSLPIRVPKGRGAYTPALGISYSSSAGNGWLGVGFDLAVSKIEIDSRWGVPTYADAAAPRYLLDGAELVPSPEPAEGPTCDNGHRYRARIEGAFAHVLRCGNDPATMHWEVHDRDGTLFVYGDSDDTRLASYENATTHNGIFRWGLSRVQDVHGNTTLFHYTLEDDTSSAEESRELYPKSIEYTSGGGLSSAFSISFALDDGTRPDRIVSGRAGFKTVTKHLLRAIHVAFHGQNFRDYVLSYGTGEFDKSILTSVEVFDGSCDPGTYAFTLTGCAPTSRLSQHTFEWMTEDRSFSPPATWDVSDDPDPDNSALGRGETDTLSGSAGVSYGKGSASGGADVNGSIGRRKEFVGMYDVNSDGLPDQVFILRASTIGEPATFTVLYNQSGPGGNPEAGGAFQAGPLGITGLVGLGQDDQFSVGADTHGNLWKLSGSLGFSDAWSNSTQFVTDLDGDGYLDMVNGSGTSLLGYPCAPGLCFNTIPFGATGAIDPRADLTLQLAEADIKSRFPMGDPVVQWVAPWDGTITVTGTAHKVNAGGVDGVTVEAYAGDTLLDRTPIAPDDTDTIVFPAPSTFDVTAGQAIYLRVATGNDDGIGSDGTPHDLVDARLDIRYARACTELGCTDVSDAAHEPSVVPGMGLPVFAFDSNRDFKVAGQPSPLVISAGGILEFHALLVKEPSLADLRVCVQQFRRVDLLTTPILDRPCSENDADVTNVSGTLNLPAGNQAFQPLDLSLSVEAGQLLMVRVEADLSFDPSDVALASEAVDIPMVSYSQVCVPSISGGGAVDCSTDPAQLAKAPVSLANFGPFVPIRNETAAVPFVASAGELHVAEFASPAEPFVFAIRSDQHGIIWLQDCTTTSCNAMIDVPAFAVADAESVSFELVTQDGLGPSSLTAYYDAAHTFTVPLAVRSLTPPAPLQTPFGGGYRHFRTAFWTEGTAFEPTELLADAVDPAISQQRMQEIVRTLTPPLPSFSGLPLTGGQPAWTGPASGAFDSSIGLNASWLGLLVGGLTPADVGGLYAKNYARQSATLSFYISGGGTIPLQGANISPTVSASASDTDTTTDVVDMNGDGVGDVVTANKVTLGAFTGDTAGAGATSFDAGDQLRHRSGHDYSVGFSGAVRSRHTSGGRTIDSDSPDGPDRGVLGLSKGTGLAIARNETDKDLVDLNGDGLPDLVIRGQRGDPDQNTIYVQFNLGNRFGAREVYGRVQGDMLGSIDGFQSIEFDSTKNALQHETTITTSESGGFDFGVVNCSHTSKHASNRITRQLADINGDGLPDLLFRHDGDDVVHVQLNRGGDFAAPITWTLPSGWPIDMSQQVSFWDVDSVITGWIGNLLVTGPDVLAGTGTQEGGSTGCTVHIPIGYTPYQIDLGLYDANDKDTYELSLLDVDGDGVADQVLRRGQTGDSMHMFVKHNRVTGKANLLAAVHRPLGGTISLDYTRTGNTPDMPHSRQVLSKVTVDDGVELDNFPSPNVETTIAYEAGVFSRNEKEFFGFGKVTTTRTGDSVTVEDDYDTTTYATHGRLRSETRRDGGGKLFHEHDITYATLNVLGKDEQPIGADSSCIANLHPLLQRQGSDPCTPLFTVVVRDDDTRAEGGTASKTRTVRDTDRDRFGNVLVSLDSGDDAIATDDVYAAAIYSNVTTPPNWILGRAIALEVRGGTAGGTLLRSRTGHYDGFGELDTVTVDTGSGFATTTLAYDAFGNLNHVTTPPNESSQVQTFHVIYDGDVGTYPVQTVDGFQDTSTAIYDVRFGVATSETDINGQKLTRTLDAFGRLSTVSGPYDDATKPALKMEYYPDDLFDGLPRPRAVTTTHASVPSDYSGSAPADVKTVTIADGLGRAIELNKTSVVDGVTGMTTSGLVARDAEGHVITTQNPFFTPGVTMAFIPPAVKETTTITYDAMDRPVTTTYPGPENAVETASFDVVADPSGTTLFRARATDPNKNVRDSYIDHVGRTRTFVETPDVTKPASVTHYDYLATGELSHITDAENNQTSLSYDRRGLRTLLDNPDDGQIADTYDLMGNRIGLVEPNQRALGTSIHYIYDLDRLHIIDYPSKPDVTFTYGPACPPPGICTSAGRIVAVADETGTQQHEYGALGEVRHTVRTVISGNQSFTFDLRLTSDSLGRLLQIVYPDGEVVTNSYDDAGMVNKVVGAGNGWQRTYASDIRYDVFGNRDRVVYGNGVVSTWTFDPNRIRLQEVTTTLPPAGKSPTLIQDLQYSYDPGNNPRTITNALPLLTGGSGTFPGQSTLTLKYDGVDRLFEADGHAQLDAQKTTDYAQHSTFSASHNLLHKDRSHTISPNSGGTTTQGATSFASDYTYGARPHLPTRIGQLGIVYDPSGNPTTRTKLDTGSVQNLVWDDDNRLVDYTSGSVHQHNTFDASGTRVDRKSTQSETIFSSQYFDLENGTQGVKHVFAGSQRVASELTKFASGVNPTAPNKQGTAYFFHQDHLQSTHVLTDDTGGIQESLEYFADGELWVDRGPLKPVTGYLFSGKPFDPDTGFYDFGQRFYDPRASLWLGADAAFREEPVGCIARPTRLATLAYANNSPLRFIDPDGRDPFYRTLQWATEALSDSLGGNQRLSRASAMYGQKADYADKVQNLPASEQWARIPGNIWGAWVNVVDTLQRRADRAAAGEEPDEQDKMTDAQALLVIAGGGAFSEAGGALRSGPVVGRTIEGTEAEVLGGAAEGAARRLPQDIAVNPRPPPAKPLTRPIGKDLAQYRELQADIRAARAAGGRDFRVNQQQVNAQGVRVGRNRPDLQYTDANGVRQYVEYDLPPGSRAAGHRARLLANDPAGNVTLK
jgi:RHS repeat-associated protein